MSGSVWTLILTLAWAVGVKAGRGLLLLYRPTDISNDCAVSQTLRYDLSFGMGMSDTITLVLRTLSEIDYECGVEITSQYKDADVDLVVVIRFPNSLLENCDLNPNAFSIMKKNICLPICSRIFTRDVYSNFFTFSTSKKVRFRFVSNSSINTDMNAYIYEVTATSARVKRNDQCNPLNETVCVIGNSSYCFTSGVVCDGINNCGVADWFDERKSDCELPVPRLGFTPVVAIVAALLCAMLALTHLMLKCLPPLANSYFIFNANEDNRLCINPLFRASVSQSVDQAGSRWGSIIPVSSSSSSGSSLEVSAVVEEAATSAAAPGEMKGLAAFDEWDVKDESKSRTAMKIVADTLQKKFLSVGLIPVKETKEAKESISDN